MQAVRKVYLCVGIIFSLLLMFDCHVCSKSFAKKAGLTQHCRGKKHLENMITSEKRKEPDALETAAIAQRLKLTSADAALATEAMRAAAQNALETEALHQFQMRVQAARNASARNTSESNALETDARAERRKESFKNAAAIEASEAAALAQRQIEATRVAQNAVRGGFADEVKSTFHDRFSTF